MTFVVKHGESSAKSRFIVQQVELQSSHAPMSLDSWRSLSSGRRSDCLRHLDRERLRCVRPPESWEPPGRGVRIVNLQSVRIVNGGVNAVFTLKNHRMTGLLHRRQQFRPSMFSVGYE